MGWKYFWHPSDVSGNDQEATASCLKYSDAEGFSQACVEENMSAAEYISDFIVGEAAQ